MSKRRAYLGSLATGVAVAVGGCLDGGSDPSTEAGGTDDPTETTDTAAGEPTETDTAEETETGESGPPDRTVAVTGSGTVYPLAQAVAERFREREPDVDVSLSRTGTGGGFNNQFCTGQADFNNASRPITAEEGQLCADNGVEYHEIRLGVDAVTVVVNTDSDWVDCVTTAELREIWRADGATTWADVRAEWPDEEIERYGPASTSGTFDYFDEAVLGADATHTSGYEPTEQDKLIVQGVAGNRFAIGYLGLAYYRNNSDIVKALGVETDSGCIEPSLDTAAGGEYPLSRPLYTYVNTDRLGEAHVAEFARFFVEQSEDEALVADGVGYVPNSEARMQEQLDALNAVIDDVQSDAAE
ncbi:PstS family phosphate ABC transporter substrate-binding protein [Haloarcula sediminis]|uniref:PstS family phosphate ABC transporter substrate-binding protein n=1 Tax=Haloarcula sediminis TaxID=3111777 RepID=UPI002D76E6E1|nr:PstS family phosphate ABC transporter substrate-binding protein [Haloarcula sp. CK38]